MLGTCWVLVGGVGTLRAADGLAAQTDRTDWRADVEKECILLALQIGADVTLS